jgi:type I restriction enzyme S subunit
LTEVAELNPRRFSQPITDDTLVSFVPMKAVEEESGRLNPSETRSWAAVKKGYTPFQDDDVIFAKITPCMENGKYAIARGLHGGRAAGSTEFHVLRPSCALDPHFLLYFLFGPEVRRAARLNMRGAAGQLRVPPLFFENLELPLPPIDHQREIVAEIEKQFTRLEAGVAGLRRVQANLKRYHAAVLKAACEGKLVPTEAELAREREKVAAASRRCSSEENQSRDGSATQEGPGYETGAQLLDRILTERHQKWKGKGKYKEPAKPETEGLEEMPEGWGWATWEQIATSQNGRPFPSSQYVSSGFKLLRPGNLHASGKIVWTEENTRYMPQHFADENPDLIVRGGELVMNLTAQSLKEEFLGRVCLTDDGEECLLNQRLARLSPVIVSPEFALYLLKARRFRRFVDRLNSGSLIQHMFTSQLAQFTFPLPPLTEQRRIVAEVERRLSVVEELEAAVNANLQRASRLRQSILKRAFEGRFVNRSHYGQTGKLADYS